MGHSFKGNIYDTTNHYVCPRSRLGGYAPIEGHPLDRSALPQRDPAAGLAHLAPGLMLHGDPTAAATLQVYARACGMDVAAWHLHHLGGWLSDAEVQRDGVALADSTLAFEATHTDDPIEFCRLYQSAFCAGYRAYQVAIEAESTRGRKIQRQSDQVIITTAGGTVRVARSLYDYLEAVHTDDPNALWDGNFWEQVGALIEGVQIEYAGEVQKVEGAV